MQRIKSSGLIHCMNHNSDCQPPESNLSPQIVGKKSLFFNLIHLSPRTSPKINKQRDKTCMGGTMFHSHTGYRIIIYCQCTDGSVLWQNPIESVCVCVNGSVSHQDTINNHRIKIITVKINEEKPEKAEICPAYFIRDWWCSVRDLILLLKEAEEEVRDGGERCLSPEH